jgi:hypothetical protein
MLFTTGPAGQGLQLTITLKFLRAVQEVSFMFFEDVSNRVL